jgi:hypothetical protein
MIFKMSGGGNMEQRQLPIVIFIMAFFLIAGLIIKEIENEYFSVPQLLADFYEWMRWKIMPGW